MTKIWKLTPLYISCFNQLHRAPNFPCFGPETVDFSKNEAAEDMNNDSDDFDQYRQFSTQSDALEQRFTNFEGHRWDKRRTIAVTAIAVHRTIARSIVTRLRYRWLNFRYTR